MSVSQQSGYSSAAIHFLYKEVRASRFFSLSPKASPKGGDEALMSVCKPPLMQGDSLHMETTHFCFPVSSLSSFTTHEEVLIYRFCICLPFKKDLECLK